MSTVPKEPTEISVETARRGIASGTSSTLVNTGFLLSLGFAFAIMAVSVPLPTLQAIFSGQAVALGPAAVASFIGAIRKVFIVMAAVSLYAAVPASMSGRSGQKAYAGEGIE